MGTIKFKQFKDECLRLQKEWGLSGWSLDFTEDKMPKNVNAQICINLKGRSAGFFFDSKNKNFNPNREAKHEMIHLILGRLSELGYHRFINKNELDESEEEVVKILEKLL